MHKKLIASASFEQLKEFTIDALSMLKETNPKTYKDLEMHLYSEIYGMHFCDWMLEYALSEMINEDGTMGGHWTLEQTNSVAKSNNLTFDIFNEYDWNYTMNMIYSDYYGAVSNDTSSYYKLSKKFLYDKDGIEGKALCYYLNIAKK